MVGRLGRVDNADMGYQGQPNMPTTRSCVKLILTAALVLVCCLSTCCAQTVINIGVPRSDPTLQYPVLKQIWQPTADYLSKQIYPDGSKIFNVIVYEQYDVPGSYVSLYDAAAAQGFDYFISNPTITICLIRSYPNTRNLAGRVALQTINGVQVEAYSTVGSIVSKNYAAWTNQRRYIPYAPLGVPQNITDLAGRMVAISDPIATPSGNFLIKQISLLGGNLYQDAAMVAICCQNDQSEYTPDQLSGALPMVGGGNGGLTYSAKPKIVLPPTGRPNPSYLYPSALNATSYGPEQSFVAMPWADPLLLTVLQTTLLGLNQTTCPSCTNSAAQAPGPYSRWTSPYDLTAMEASFIATGVLNGTGACVPTSSNALDNAIATIVCPAGYFRLSRAAIIASCPSRNLTVCPSWSLVCICKPCAPVPAEAIKISIAIGPAVNASSYNGVACAKLTTCSTVRQLDSVTIVASDAYGPQLRSLLGLAVPTTLAYSYSLDPSSTAAPVAMSLVSAASADGTTGAIYSAVLPSPQLGFWLLTVTADGAVVASAPTVVRGVPPTCPGSQQATASGSCACTAPAGLSAALDPITCLPLYSAGGLLGGILGGAVAVVAVLFAWQFMALRQKLEEGSGAWRIKKAEIAVDVPPVVLGIGSYGVVLRGTYRGSAVALKRAHRLHDRLSTGLLATGTAAVKTGAKGMASSRAALQMPPMLPPMLESLGGVSDIAGLNRSSGALSSSATVLPLPVGTAPDPRSLASPVAPSVLMYVKAADEMRAAASAVHLQRMRAIYSGSAANRSSSTVLGLGPDLFTSKTGGTESRDAWENIAADDDGALAASVVLSPPAAAAVTGSAADGAWLDAISTFRLQAHAQNRRQGSVAGTDYLDTGRAGRGTGAALSSGSFVSSGSGAWSLAMALWGLCGGGRVAVRPRSLPADYMAEIKLTVSLRHPRIISVLGAVIEPDSDPVLVFELMDRGSLQELLLNASVDLRDFLVPLIRDIAEGMVFLHLADPPILHNDLKSANVLVDSSFAAKISDFGMSSSGDSGSLTAGTPAWLAPELLRGERPTTKSDVYAFGILLWEMFARAEPYAGENMFEVMAAVADPTRCKRPWGEAATPPSNFCPEYFGLLMSRCCDHDPLKRPTFQEILGSLRALDLPGLVDAMLARAVGASKSADLLHGIFPPRVAKALAEGRTVEPEHYDCVTVFFSDIVGFTDISSSLPPEKVMNMLNRLYLAFDQLTLKYGLFKVETIGDAYMVVGNLPVADQEWPCVDHTSRIAKFGLEAIRAANSVTVLEDDESRGRVNIRAGFHSGPVVASVVGKANPRYCLFGDTVNMASRMESNSVKNRVNVSLAAATLLVQQTPSYKEHLEPRGKVKIKGKGMVSCYFLHEMPLSREMRKTASDSLRFGPKPATPGSDKPVGRITWTPGELLGKGAFGRVYLGLNQDSGELCAVKVLDYALLVASSASTSPAGTAEAARTMTLGTAVYAAHAVQADPAQSPKAAAAAQAAAAGRWLTELEAEIDLCRSLNHPNLVRYIACQQEASGDESASGAELRAQLPCVAIFMEYVPGGSLASLIAKFGTVSGDVAKRYTREMVLGLDYLHASAVVHRDLKGANVMVTRTGGIKIGDLGSAIRNPKLVGTSLAPLATPEIAVASGRGGRRRSTLTALAEETPRPTASAASLVGGGGEVSTAPSDVEALGLLSGSTDRSEALSRMTSLAAGPRSGAGHFLDDSICDLSMRGSVCWMAPELLTGKPYGRRVDIWSLGSVVVEMLTGEAPFVDLVTTAPNARTAAALISAAIAGGARPEVAGYDAADGPALRSFLGRCFEVDPQKRASAAELLEHPWLSGAEH